MSNMNKVKKDIINEAMSDKRMEEMMKSPCTIIEATQIARGVAEDVVHQYLNQISHVNIAISLQIELIKQILIENGLITEEKFKELYIEQATKFNEMQAQKAEQVPESETKTSMDAHDIEIKKV